MKILGDTVQHEGFRVSLIDREFLDRNGKNQTYEVVKPKNADEVVYVFAIDPDGSALLILQQRIALGACDDKGTPLSVIECAGGVIKGHTDYDRVIAQELKEELGVTLLEKPELLAVDVPMDVGRYNLTSRLYIARVSHRGEQQLEDSEECRVLSFPVDGLVRHMVETGYPTDPRVFMCLALAQDDGIL